MSSNKVRIDVRPLHIGKPNQELTPAEILFIAEKMTTALEKEATQPRDPNEPEVFTEWL
ncbi:MAG: hypothetical protein HY308_04260 [Gammaproteobacteria bacterium]|nr:hypothetical protein [Gammaproteobacteria bacterium]